MPRARVLQARTAIAALRSVVRTIEKAAPTVAADIDRQLEQLEASTVQFAQMRASHLVQSGAARLDASERAETERLFAGHSPAQAMMLGPNAAASDVQTAALDGIARWRNSAADPLADRLYIEVCDVVTRTYEQFYASTV